MFTSDYLHIYWNGFMYFSLKADDYSKPGEKSFNCLQEMNKVSDGMRIIVTAGCCCYLIRFNSCCCVETRSTLCLGSEVIWGKGLDLSLSLLHIFLRISTERNSTVRPSHVTWWQDRYWKVNSCSVHKCITLGWILQQSTLGCKGILLQNIYMLSNLI